MEPQKQRESFGSRLGFILVSAGCAIGIGNVWRFPTVTGQNGFEDSFTDAVQRLLLENAALTPAAGYAGLLSEKTVARFSAICLVSTVKHWLESPRTASVDELVDAYEAQWNGAAKTLVSPEWSCVIEDRDEEDMYIKVIRKEDLRML